MDGALALSCRNRLHTDTIGAGGVPLPQSTFQQPGASPPGVSGRSPMSSLPIPAVLSQQQQSSSVLVGPLTLKSMVRGLQKQTGCKKRPLCLLRPNLGQPQCERRRRKAMGLPSNRILRRTTILPQFAIVDKSSYETRPQTGWSPASCPCGRPAQPRAWKTLCRGRHSAGAAAPGRTRQQNSVLGWAQGGAKPSVASR